MLIVVYDVNVLLIVLTTQRDGFDKEKYVENVKKNPLRI